MQRWPKEQRISQQVYSMKTRLQQSKDSPAWELNSKVKYGNQIKQKDQIFK